MNLKDLTLVHKWTIIIYIKFTTELKEEIYYEKHDR